MKRQRVEDSDEQWVELKVPYSEKDAAKALGAQWDARKKTWYARSAHVIAACQKWILPRTYLEVPYEEKDKAKSLGAKWDAEQKKWYTDNKTDGRACKRWAPKKPRKKRAKPTVDTM